MWEWIELGASLAGLVAYELYLGRLAVRAPMKTARSAHAAIRTIWVRTVMSHPGTEILVIQTLRNSVMAASLMGTTSVLALSGTLTLSGIGSTAHGIWTPGTEFDMMHVLVFLLAATFLVSFLLLAMAVRFFNHTGYLIGGAVATEEPRRFEALAISYLNRASHLYSLGLRAFFVCIPILAGLFSTLLILPATAILIFTLYLFDRVPAGEVAGIAAP